jgi:hypothetical protein
MDLSRRPRFDFHMVEPGDPAEPVRLLADLPAMGGGAC